jgi:hypothetical protein
MAKNNGDADLFCGFCHFDKTNENLAKHTLFTPCLQSASAYSINKSLFIPQSLEGFHFTASFL